MDKAEARGFGIATIGHIALLAALTLGFSKAAQPPMLSQPMEVSFVEDIGLQNAAPDPATEPPAQSVAPDIGPPEDAAPAPAPSVTAPPEPEPVPTPAVKPAPAKAEPKPQPAKPAPKAAPAKEQPKKQAASGSGTAEKARGSRLGKNFLSGIGRDPTTSTSQKPPGVMNAQALAGIEAAIRRQVQPCADRMVSPGPGANRIRVKLNLRLNPDGSLRARPTVVSISGDDAENGRYVERVKDLAIATFTGCSPLRGLPEELYETPRGGWSNFNMNYNLP
jgi:outer membrane biosynthesis protein TonB